VCRHGQVAACCASAADLAGPLRAPLAKGPDRELVIRTVAPVQAIGGSVGAAVTVAAGAGLNRW